MKTEEPIPASAKDQESCPPAETCGTDDFEPKVDLPGKTDSGPEPDVFPVTPDN